MERHHLLQPLIIPTADSATASTLTAEKTTVLTPTAEQTTTGPSNAAIVSRLAFMLFMGIISIWANHEASKGFAITIVNEAGNSLAGKRFSVFYQSNDKAERIILSTSNFVEHLLYVPSDPRKQVNSVVLRLGQIRRNTTQVVEVEYSVKTHEFTLHLSPWVMEEQNFNHAIYSAVQRGMARVWLWNGNGNTPELLVNAMADYISSAAEFEGSREITSGLTEFGTNDCLNSAHLAEFLKFCEREKPGFVRRLNAEMKDSWNDAMVDDALGMPAHRLCASYHSSR